MKQDIFFYTVESYGINGNYYVSKIRKVANYEVWAIDAYKASNNYFDCLQDAQDALNNLQSVNIKASYSDEAIEKGLEMMSSDPTRDKLELELECFKQNALAKYDKGRAEHGDDLSRLDYDREIQDEVVDIVNYLLLKKIV